METLSGAPRLGGALTRVREGPLRGGMPATA